MIGAALVLALCVGAGALVGVQPMLNARLAATLGSPVAATLVSLGVSIACVLPVAAFAGLSVRTDELGAAPWWVWCGGVAGAALVGCGLVFAPRIGVTLFFGAVVAGQLLAAALVDHHGWFGAPVRPIDPMRLAGIALVFAGVVVFRLARPGPG